MSLLEKKYIHCIGIGGIGVSALAKILIQRGCVVSGSDAEQSLITDELLARGISVNIGKSDGGFPLQTEAIVYSSAVPTTHPERIAALDRGIEQFSYAQVLGELSRAYHTIAISGTHGKSTTTALLGNILIAAGYDPLVLVGTRVASFSDGNAHLGAGTWFVVEACEHEAQMMQISPEYLIVTNVEPDHLDFYETFDRLLETFRAYVRGVRSERCVLNFDDENVRALAEGAHTFGFTGGTVQCLHRTTTSGIQTAHLITNHDAHFTMSLRIPGRFNVMNAMAAFEMARMIGIDADVALRALNEYPGSWRRFERVGEVNGAAVISDYGHHPTALKETVRAAREFFPGRRILLAYQPHQHHRTKALHKEFIDALHEPDALILNEIYDVKGREGAGDQDISSATLYEEVVAQQIGKPIWYARTHAEVVTLITTHATPQDVVLIMGAGDIYKIVPQVCVK